MAKIIIIGTTASSFYGFRSDLVKDLVKRGHQVFAFISEFLGDDLTKIESLGATPVLYNLSRGGLNPISDIKSTYLLAQKIKKINPNLVLSYFAKPVIYGTLAARLAKVPKVYGMLEGLGYTFTEQPNGIKGKTRIVRNIQILLYRIALPTLDKIIFLNKNDPQDLIEAHSIRVRKTEILGGIGLNLKDYPYSPIANTQSSINFLFIGRLLKEKGIHDFILAAKLVKEKYPNTQFTVIGAIDKSNLGSLQESELNELISSNIIDYPGHVDNVKDWISKCHVFILPSYREGLPRSTQEAMAMGRPIITTDVPGCRDTVIDGANGFLVPRWNPQALAEKMIYFIENPGDISLMGKASYEIAKERFDAKKVNQQLINILDLQER